MNSFETLTIDLRQMIFAIEAAVSQVGMNDTNHGKRVGYIASQLAHHLDWDEADIQFAFELGLLHDSGVSTEQMHSALVNHFDWRDAYIHCEIGYRLLKDFEPLARFAGPIRYHHTPWEKLRELDISQRDKQMANLIFLSDRIDVLAVSHYENDILLARQEVMQSILRYRGSYFDPELVAAFQLAEQSEAFWIALEDRHVTRYVWDMGQYGNREKLSIAQIKQLSLIMAYIVDQKSPFTARHSVRVAGLARYLADKHGLPGEQCDKIEIAGLLHDLGKLHMPDQILEKPGPLTPLERSIMNKHSFETFQILRHIQGLNEIADWAAFHHEELNGAGYPFHRRAQELSIEARIIAVADVFQALVQDRPYRAGMQMDEVLIILEEYSQSGKLDPEISALARQHAEACFRIALGQNRPEGGKSLRPA
ncbi:HD-GYP domain-containing protein [Sedimenticola thiotaurini]|uniref:Phosphodiesterase n=1 Tax=Sedimenticola thiotaurini TaxID=1543721 RepID=A0A0F7JWC3_9GAMM|nr:HD domain-containing phosphohydrolase [Sedimenticola thiotaurini]AKH19962.1 phosphodiesterase [Sedimenticola thiotaurini]